MMTLLKEMHTLKCAVETLTARLEELEAALAQLMKTKASLEHDIRLKDVALYVDREKCLALRQNFSISTFKESRYPSKALDQRTTPVRY